MPRMKVEYRGGWFDTKLKLVGDKAVIKNRSDVGTMPLLSYHDGKTYIGTIDKVYVKDNVIYADATLKDLPKAKEEYEEIRQGKIGTSIGFIPREYDYVAYNKKTKEDGYVEISQIELLEISLVSVGALGNARVLSYSGIEETDGSECINIGFDYKIGREYQFQLMKTFVEGKQRHEAKEIKEKSEAKIRENLKENIIMGDTDTKVEQNYAAEIVSYANEVGDEYNDFSKDAIEFANSGRTFDAFRDHVVNKLKTVAVHTMQSESERVDRKHGEYDVSRLLRHMMHPEKREFQVEGKYELDASNEFNDGGQPCSFNQFIIPWSAMTSHTPKKKSDYNISVTTGDAGIGVTVDQANAHDWLMDYANIAAQATVIQATNNLSVPAWNEVSTPSWLGDGVEPTPGNSTIRNADLSPKTVAVSEKITNLADIMSGNYLATALQVNLGRRLGDEMNRGIVAGSGSSNEPRGIVNFNAAGNGAAIQDVSTGSPPSLAGQKDITEYLKPYTTVLNKKVNGPKTMIVGMDAYTHALSNSFTGSGRLLMDALEGTPNLMVLPTTHFGAGNGRWVVVGDMRMVFVGMWGGLRVHVNTSMGQSRVIQLSIYMDVDCPIGDLFSVMKFAA